MKNKILFLIAPFIFVSLAHADTRDQIRKEEIEQKPTTERYQTEEYRKEKYLTGNEGNLKTKELGAWPNEHDVSESTVYRFVLKVSCSDGDADLVPHIPRNRTVDWTFKNNKTLVSAGSAHIDQDGYVRFVVNNTKTERVKEIKVKFNSEEKVVNVGSGPFDLVFKRSTCTKKQADKAN